jgi:hypothetical protein
MDRRPGLCDHDPVEPPADRPDEDPVAEPPRVTGLLDRLEHSDGELTAPPADLWDRIATAVAGDSPHGEPSGAGTVIEYRIDAADVLVGVGGDWESFADRNDAPELATTTGTGGQTLWDAIGDGPLRDLWRAAVSRVRATGAPVTIPFRCDGPTTRRWFDMTLTPAADGSVAFRSVLTFEMTRPEIPALRRHIARDTALAPVEICCWCAEASHDGRWQPVEEVLADARLLEAHPPPPVAYGLCPRCSQRMAETLLPAEA